jgi:hypothetical protein
MSKAQLSRREMVAKQLVEHLSHDAESQPGAILLTGAWGVGKTYLWRHHVVNSLKKQSVAYISLFGVSTTAELKSRLLAALIVDDELDASGIKKMLGIGVNLVKNAHKLAGAGAQIAAKRYLGEEAAHLLGALDIKFDALQLVPKGLVICFDDVERKALSDDEFLGFINSLIDQKSARVVIIANEEKLKEKFQDFKEKIVWLTYKCDASPDDLIEKFITTVGSKKSQKSLKALTPVFLACFHKAQHQNLRTLQRAIRLLDLAVREMILPEHFAQFLIALVIEDATRPGLSKDPKVYQGVRHFKAALGNKSNRAVELEGEDKISAEFSNTFFGTEFVGGFSPAIHQYVRDGYLDVQTLRDEVEPPDTRPVAIKLAEEGQWGGWYFQSDADATVLLNRIASMLTSSEDMHIGVAIRLRRSLGRIARHLRVTIPDVSLAMEKRILQRARTPDTLDRHDRFTDQDEMDDSKPFYDRYEAELQLEVLSRIKAMALTPLKAGQEPSLSTTEYKYSPQLLMALADEEVLNAADANIKRSPESHFRFYQFAIEQARSRADGSGDILAETIRKRLEAAKAYSTEVGELHRLRDLLEQLSKSKE